MRIVRPACAAAAAALLAGCAGSVSAPVPVEPLAMEQGGAIHLSSVTADAAEGVPMSEADFGLISQEVKSYIEMGSPGVMDDKAAMTMKIHFTKFDRGNAFARFMLIGLGQIRIEADVDLLDGDGKRRAEYKVAKDFSIGGIYGGMTTVEDVENGFAKSVAEVVKAKS